MPDYREWVIDGTAGDKIFINYATAAEGGLMSSADFSKLAALPSGGISLQKAYDGGSTIVPVADTPVTIEDAASPASSYDLFLVKAWGGAAEFWKVDNLGEAALVGPFNIGTNLDGNVASPPVWLVAGGNVGVTLSNNLTATLAEPVQNSPTFTFFGRAFRTSNSTSRSTAARLVMQSVSGTSTSENLLIRMRAPNQGAFNTRFTFSEPGALTVVDSIITPTIGTSSSTQHALPTGTGDLASLSLAQTWTASQNVASVALTDGTNIATDASLGNVFTVTLGGNRTLDNPTNLVSGGTYVWIITQGAGGQTLGYDNLFKWPGGVVPTLSTGASEVDVITAVYDGTILCAQITKDFS